MTFSLQARVVFPVDRPAIEHGVVTIDGERIIAVGTKAEASDVMDLGSVALLPGLVNCHTHLEFSYCRQPLGRPGMSLIDWIRLVIAERGRGARPPKEDAQQGLVESIASGVTTIGDITTGPVTTDADITHFHEVIAFSRARAESALAALRERLAFQPAEGSRIRHGISPHAPYTVSPKLVKELVAVARQRGLPMAMHLAESREELDLLRDGSGPYRALLEDRSMWDSDAIPRESRPMDYLQMLAEAPRALAIHGNYLTANELRFLGAQREQMSLVYCPRTHAYFCHPPYPLGEALAAGVRVALGTDSRASNPDLSLLAEMRHVARAHPWLDPWQVIHMGTLAGAEALGRADEVGSITTGKLANLVAIALPDHGALSVDESLSALFASEEKACNVWLHGAAIGE